MTVSGRFCISEIDAKVLHFDAYSCPCLEKMSKAVADELKDTIIKQSAIILPDKAVAFAIIDTLTAEGK